MVQLDVHQPAVLAYFLRDVLIASSIASLLIMLEVYFVTFYRRILTNLSNVFNLKLFGKLPKADLMQIMYALDTQ